MTILQTALRELLRRWQAIPPAVRRTHWPASVLCLVTGGAWSHITLRIDQAVFRDRNRIDVLDTWAQAWSHGVVFDAIATAIGVAIGLELAQRVVRILAWDLRRQLLAESAVPFPERNLRFSAYYTYGRLFFVALLLVLFLGVPVYTYNIGVISAVMIVYAVVVGPFEAFHMAARFIAWEERKRAERAGEPWLDGPVSFSWRRPHGDEGNRRFGPRDGEVTFAVVLVAIGVATVAVLDLPMEPHWSYGWHALVGDTVRAFAGTFVGTFFMLDGLYHVIRLREGPGAYGSLNLPPTRRRRL